jgi:hypothetical protein
MIGLILSVKEITKRFGGLVALKNVCFVKDPQYLRPLRTPPFYAIKFSGAILGTMGG